MSIHNLDYIESVWESFRRDNASVSKEWREFFNNGGADGLDLMQRRSWNGNRRSPIGNGNDRFRSGQLSDVSAQERLVNLVRAFRVRGHMMARIDPLGGRPPAPEELNPAFFGFSESDWSREFTCESLFWPGPMKLSEILDRLKETYCRFIGVQYMHIDDLATRQWLQKRMEGTLNRIELTPKIQRRIFSRLTDAVVFEEFVRKKFLGAKTFSLEGCESLIPLLELAIEKAGGQGVKEIVLAMAHRGRLNVLVNILHKSASQIFHEFADENPEKYFGGGDVKYHLGFSNDWKTSEGVRVHLSLCFNPSHLEYVNPVALGRVRAKQDRVNDSNHDECMALLIHGDASMAGEGIVQETLNLSQLGGYATGGALHVVVNNQIGFTTPPEEGRSCLYATDVARLLQAPIFHVNGENPEAVAQCLHVAMDFRRRFKRDVFIDMHGYRRLGHNEADEPSFTQPLLYTAIAKRPSVREGYLEHLLELKGLTREEANAIADRRRAHLEKKLSESRQEDYQPPAEKLQGIWARSRYHGGPESGAAEADTGVKVAILKRLFRQLLRTPSDFTPHPKVERFHKYWSEMAKGGRLLDWSAAETLAFASLAVEGVPIRLSGQDSARGTFSQRHAILHDYEGKGAYVPLQNMAHDQAPVRIYNSPLSEAGVLGFDYGYSLECPDGLVLWEAQFGDFVNAAQVIVDQFIASAEDKWRRLSGIVLLLPHGFEGMGPEHASARLERFLQLCAEDNIQVVHPSTPAQYFHLLRRQALRLWRKPLVVMTPKSLLRLSECASSLNELAFGAFQRILPDTREIKKPRRVLLCSGKIYYELERRRKERESEDAAILRIEQFYPWRMDLLEKALNPYPRETPVFWVQEEPENMGAWEFLRLRLGEKIANRWPLFLVSRTESASPATGSAKAHQLEQARLIDQAFDGDSSGGN